MRGQSSTCCSSWPINKLLPPTTFFLAFRIVLSFQRQNLRGSRWNVQIALTSMLLLQKHPPKHHQLSLVLLIIRYWRVAWTLRVSDVQSPSLIEQLVQQTDWTDISIRNGSYNSANTNALTKVVIHHYLEEFGSKERSTYLWRHAFIWRSIYWWYVVF